MNRRLKLIAVLAILFSMTAGVFTTEAANKDLTGDWFLWVIDSIDSTQQYLISALNTDVYGNPTYVLKQDGDKLIGNGEGKFGTMSVQGVVTGDDFVLKGIIGKMDAYLTGTFENNRITGKIIVGFDEADFVMKRK